MAKNQQYPIEALVAWEVLRVKINKTELARYLGISHVNLSAWRAIPDKYVDDVSAFLDIPVSKLRPDKD